MQSGQASLQPIRYDPQDYDTIQDPLPSLRRMQDDAPLFWSDALQGWIVTRYEDAKTVQLDPGYSADRLTSFYESQSESRQARIVELIRYLNTWVAFKDPPAHQRLRQKLNRILTHAVVKRLDAAIHGIANDLLDRLEAKGVVEFDFISDFANPLPAYVIMDLLGVPRSDMESLRKWSGMIQPFLGSSTVSGNKYDLGGEGMRLMADYFSAAVAAREQHPTDDVIGHFVGMKQQGEMTEDDVVGTCILFLFAGHETTTNLIGNGVRALIANPAEAEKLRARPELIDSAVEEMLRYDGPTGTLVRVTKEDREMHGQQMKAGQRVYIMINAANHDPRKFEAPERFDIERNPNPHLTFNTGPHFCLGAPLARAEGRVAITELLRRFKTIRLTSPAQYMDTLVMRGVREMPVAVERF